MGKYSTRSCICCRKKGEKRSLLRFVLLDDKVVFDEEQVQPGRGAYVHSEAGCLNQTGAVRIWERAFRKESGGRWNESIRACVELARSASGVHLEDGPGESSKKKPVRL